MDFLASKGLEYLLAIFYLLAIIPFSLAFLRRRPAPVATRSAGWFEVPEGLSFHLGHAWAKDRGDRRIRIGLDDYAAHVLGAPQAFELPAEGEVLRASSPGWRLQVDGEKIPFLAPVSGRVTARNEAVLEHPELALSDPYGEGWLLEVEPGEDRSLRALLSGRLARTWMAEAEAGLRALVGGSLGPVLQDGGVPVAGLARELSPEAWPTLARRLLLVD